MITGIVKSAGRNLSKKRCYEIGEKVEKVKCSPHGTTFRA